MRQLQSNNYLGTNTKSYHADGIIISETAYGEDVYEGWHSHAHHHLGFVLSGGSREEHKSGYAIEEAPGQLTFYRSDDQHRSLHTKPRTKVINVQIEDHFLQQYAINIEGLNPQTLNRPVTKFKFLKLYKESAEINNKSSASIHLQILHLLSCVTITEKGRPVWLMNLKELLHDRWNEQLSLTEMAAILHVHPVTISKYFSHYFGCTLSEYLRNIRLEKSVSLLKTTKLSLTEIAYTCAFYDQSHFIRHFKNATGFLPGEFKKK